MRTNTEGASSDGVERLRRSSTSLETSVAIGELRREVQHLTERVRQLELKDTNDR